MPSAVPSFGPMLESQLDMTTPAAPGIFTTMTLGLPGR